MATTIIVGKACKQATSAYRRELGLAWLVVPAHSVSPACRPDLKNSWAGRPGGRGPSKKCLDAPQPLLILLLCNYELHETFSIPTQLILLELM